MDFLYNISPLTTCGTGGFLLPNTGPLCGPTVTDNLLNIAYDCSLFSTPIHPFTIHILSILYPQLSLLGCPLALSGLCLGIYHPYHSRKTSMITKPSLINVHMYHHQ
jgi:hypothetical protein